MPAHYDAPIPSHPGSDETVLSPSEIVGLLAEDDRLRVAAAVVLGAANLDEIVGATGLVVRDAAVALDRLRRGGLVVTGEDGGLRLAGEALKLAARVPAEPRAQGFDEPEDQVLRSFVRNGELVTIPAARSKRLVVLEWLAMRFEPGRTYPEAEVDRLLRTVHPDHAALRRYLVDEGFLERREGSYWRAGGAFDVD